MTHDIVQIQVFDPSMNLVGIIDDYEYFRFVRNWYDLDTWEIDINRYKVNVDRFELGGFIRYSREGADRIGIIGKIEKPLDETGRGGEQWKISGRGIEGIFAHRICLNLTSVGTGYDTSGNVGETCLRWYVEHNAVNAKDGAGGADASRNLAGITLEAVDSGRGSEVEYSARFNILSEVLYDICKSSGLSFRLVWSGTGLNFVFTPLEGSDVSASVVLSPEFGNVKSFQYLDSMMDTRNHLYLGGAGTDTGREMSEYYADVELTGWDRREAFIEASDCSGNEQLDAKGAETLETLGEEQALEVEYLSSPSFTYGDDFDLGDVIKVVFPGVVTVESRVVSVTEEWDENGERITLGIGREYPDRVSIAKAERRAYSAQVRR